MSCLFLIPKALTHKTHTCTNTVKIMYAYYCETQFALMPIPADCIHFTRFHLMMLLGLIMVYIKMGFSLLLSSFVMQIIFSSKRQYFFEIGLMQNLHATF